ncbi:MAG: type II secretion system protein GspD, partial [Deltaproteobacteria bacterium]|nr:type II secretion system protein GspD [Deltaproteobacteria bacterium]
NRKAKTVVVVDDQQTVVIGGLMRDRTRDSESKIPILGDLPLVGWLFRQRSHEVEKVNLLLVLTPYIIRDANDFQKIFERKIQEHEDFAAEYYGHRPEYRAHIDYAKKSGPLAKMVKTLRHERDKVENGGTGGGEELLITPDRASEEEGIPVPPEAPAPEGGPVIEPMPSHPPEIVPPDMAPPAEGMPAPGTMAPPPGEE